MSTSVTNSPTQGLKGQVRGLQHESLYAAWTTHCLLHDIEPKEVLPSVLLKRSVFEPMRSPEEDVPLFAELMNTTVRHIRQMCGHDISGVIGLKAPLLYRSMRYCKECMQMGYHSIMFQHIGLAECPLHGARLQDTCYECGSPMEPTFGSVMEHQFECPRCNAPLVRFTLKQDGAKLANLIDQMLGARRPVLVRGVDVAHQAHRLRNLDYGLRSPMNPVASRHFQRVSIWPLPGDTQWRTFVETKVPILEPHGREQTNAARELHIATDRFLLSALAKCKGHELATIRLLGRLGRYPRGLRLNAHTSVISVALYKIAAAYDLLPRLRMIVENKDTQPLRRSFPEFWARPPVRHGDGCPEYPQLDAHLLEQEMWGMFAKLLVAHQTDSYLQEVSWLSYPHALEFAPSWRIEKSNDEAYARVRTRACEATISRLIQRRRNDVLLFRDYDPIGDDGLWTHNFLDSLWHENEAGKKSAGSTPSTWRSRATRARNEDFIRLAQRN
ncbi:MAG: hypothetical protein A2Z93_01545 [Curvibacter sp. GWA2_64_110]|nr:MAG: hypothetical protein A2Z93_01545 [Curvibacter sp. GWA2_64_110]HCY15443.1 hypothetical protein [Curvibacter sp.]